MGWKSSGESGREAKTGEVALDFKWNRGLGSRNRSKRDGGGAGAEQVQGANAEGETMAALRGR